MSLRRPSPVHPSRLSMCSCACERVFPCLHHMQCEHVCTSCVPVSVSVCVHRVQVWACVQMPHKLPSWRRGHAAGRFTVWEEAVCFQALGPSEPDCGCLSTPQCVLIPQLPRQPSRAPGLTISQGCRGSLLALHLKHVHPRGRIGAQRGPKQSLGDLTCHTGLASLK